MPASGIKLLDANIWLALAFSDHQHHAKAAEWFSLQAEGSCAFCRITQMALLRHLTNSKIMGKFVQSQQAAWQSYDAFLNDPRVSFLYEPSGVDAVFRSFSRSDSPSHARWTDAYLAAFAAVESVQLVTFEKTFPPSAGLDLLILDS